jgi:hypothetical protein
MSAAKATTRTRARAAAEGRARPAFNAAESPIGWLSRRRDKDGRPLISEEQLLAAERLRADFYFAQMTPRVTADWCAPASGRSGRRPAPGAGVELRDGVIAAAERVRRALASVGPELAGVLIDVCCHLKGLEEVERNAGWPQRSGKVVLQFALTRLARHYGLIAADGVNAAARGRLRHWGSPDYRPAVDGGEQGQP